LCLLPLQLSCMRSYFRIAVLINRALLVPTWGVAVNLMRKVEYTFPWDVPVDWARMAKCLEPGYGPQTVMTVKQYLQQYNRTFLNVTNFRGLQRSRDWAWSGGGGGVVKEFLKLNSQELEIPAWKDVPETGWLQHIPGKLTPADVASLGRALQDDVISFGELFNSFLAQPLPPLHPRQSLLQPVAAPPGDCPVCGGREEVQDWGALRGPAFQKVRGQHTKHPSESQ